MTRQATTNLNCTRMQLCDDLRITPQVHQGQTYFQVEVPSRTVFYRVGYAEYVFISLLDGATSFNEALAVTSQRLGPDALSTQQASTIYHWLLENELGTIDPFEALVPCARKPNRTSIPNPFWLRIPFGCPDKIVQRIQPAFAWLFSPTATLLGIVLLMLGTFGVACNWDRFLADSANVFSPRNWFWMSLTWVLLKIVHEVAHAVCCRRYGGEVKDCGMVFVLFAPLAYVDVTSSWRFTSKWSRIHVALAGIYMELLVAAGCAIAWHIVDAKFASHMLYNVIFMASVSTLLFNANPLMKFDGYFVLADLLEIPNLYTESNQAVRRQLKHWFFAEKPSEPHTTHRLQSVIIAYGWASALWRVLICVSLAIAASVLLHGAGIALAISAVAVWILKPVISMLRLLRAKWETQPHQFGRALAVSAGLMIVAIAVLGYVPSPSRVNAPGIVEFKQAHRVRSLTGGFVDQIHVRDGEDVEAGQLLLTLRNEEISRLYQDLILAIRQAEVRRQMASDEHDVAKAQVAQREIVALEEQLVEARRRFESLMVTAPVSGKVVQRSLAQNLGVFFDEGEELLSISNENSKEMIVSVSQHDFDSAMPRVDQQVHVRLGALPRFTARLARLEPRASTELTHEALSAIEGGPLEVVEHRAQDSDDPQAELTEPRFKAVIEIPAEQTAAVFSGQRGVALLGNRNESLGLSVYRIVSEWIEKKKELVSKQNSA